MRRHTVAIGWRCVGYPSSMAVLPNKKQKFGSKKNPEHVRWLAAIAIEASFTGYPFSDPELHKCHHHSLFMHDYMVVTLSGTLSSHLRARLHQTPCRNVRTNRKKTSFYFLAVIIWWGKEGGI